MKDPADERQQQQHKREKRKNGVGGDGEREGVNLGAKQIFCRREQLPVDSCTRGRRLAAGGSFGGSTGLGSSLHGNDQYDQRFAMRPWESANG